MPNNDLGTAHGRIRIDFEDRGSAAAAATLAKIQKEFELLNRRVADIEKSFTQNTSTITTHTNKVKESRRETSNWISSLIGVSRVTKLLDKDIVDLTQDIIRLNKQFSETRNKYKPVETAYKILDRYQKLAPHIVVDRLNKSLSGLQPRNISDLERKTRALYGALDSVGLAGSAAVKAMKEFAYGRKGALEALPMWTRHVNAFALSLGGLSAIGLRVSKTLNAGFFTKLLDTNIFRRAVLQTTALGVALQKLGGITSHFFGINPFERWAIHLKNSEAGLTNSIKNMSHSLSGASRTFNAWFQPVAEAAKQIERFTLGIGLMVAGVGGIIEKFKWLGKIPKPLLMALGVTISAILPAAFQVLAKTLTGTSNILVGLLSGVKALSGGFLALPGIFAMVGTAAGTLVTIFSGLKDKFKDVFSDDPTKAAEAFANLPEYLKPMARALRETVKQFKEMRIEIQKIAFNGIEDQITSLTDSYMPLLNKGMRSVTLSLRGAKDEFVKFLEQGQTQTDFSTLFSKTAEAIGNLKDILRPLADGFRNIIMVGTDFITGLSGGVGGLISRFAEWTRVSRESGRMLGWMQDARAATRDLVKGTWNLTKGLWSILTTFRTSTGANFLDSYAESMKKFSAAMEKSRKGGVLFNFSNAVRGFADGREKIETFKSVFQSFIVMMNGIAPAIQNVANAFSGVFIPQLKWTMEWLGQLTKFVSSFNLDSAIGAILGFTAVIKLLPTFLKPGWNAIRIFGGAFLTLMSAKKVVKALEDGILALGSSLQKIPFIGTKVGESLVNVATSASGLISTIGRFAGPIAIVAAALTSLWMLLKTGRENAQAFDDQLKTNSEGLNQFGKDLNKAFLNDNGLIGHTVMDQISLSMNDMIQNLEDTASKAPGFIDHITDMFNPNAAIGKRSGFFGESPDINRRQAEGHAAEIAAQKLKELRKAGVDLEGHIASSQPAFDAYIENLRTQGEAGNEAANVLVKQREQFNLVYESMQRLGPAGIQISNGIKKIAESSGDAISKLEGLKTVLQGLGFLKVDALQAAADYTNAIGSMADDIRQAIDANGDVEGAFDRVNGKLNTTNKLGAALVPIFSRVSNAFLTSANSGENVDTLVARLNAELENIAPMLNMTADQLKAFFRNNLGVAPEPIKLLLQLEGKEPVAQQLAQFLTQLTASAETNVPVVLHFQTPDSANTFDKWLESQIGRDITDQKGLDVVLKTGIDPPSPDELAKLQKILSDYGIQTSPGQIVAPATMPVAPAPALPATPPAPPPPVTAVPPWVPGATPQPFTPPNNALFPAPIDMPDVSGKLNEASAKVDEIGGKMHNLLANRDNKIELNTDKLVEAETKIDKLATTFDQKKLKADIEVNGADKLDQIANSAQTVTEKLTGLFTVFKDEITQAFNAVSQRVSDLSVTVVGELDKLADAARTSGSKFVDAFAAGMNSNGMAVQAAREMADQIKSQFHQSPPKEGPLAAHGDAARYGGEQFVASYATGLRGALPAAANAAGSVAGAAVGALGAGGKGAAGTGAGQFLGQILALVNVASQITGIFQKVSDTILRAAKFMSDPMGDGSFFGKKRYKKTVSDTELQRQQNDRMNQAYLDMINGGQRNNDEFNRKLDIITNAQNAVFDQKGYKSQEAPKTVGAMLKAAFPQLADATIGGARADALPYHRQGRALDIMIPNWNTKEGKALGDSINAWVLQNAQKLGVTDTIWQDFWQPTDGGKGNFLGRTNQGPDEAHFTHVHLTFAPGAQVDMTGLQFTPQEATDYRNQAAQEDRKKALDRLQAQYGPPVDPNNLPSTPATQLQWDDTRKTFVQVTPHGTQDIPTLGPINPETNQPWTQAEIDKYKAQNPMQYALPPGFTQDQMAQVQNNPQEFSPFNQEQILKNLAQTNSDVADALNLRDNPDTRTQMSEARVSQLLEGLDNIIKANDSIDTAAGRMTTGAVQGLQSSVMQATGFSQAGNPIDTVAAIVSEATSMASDVINTIVTGIEAVGSVEAITSTLARGVSSTEDIYKNVDNVQKIIELAAGIAGSVSSVAGLAGTIVGAAGSGDTSGGTQAAAMVINAIGMIAGFVQAGFEITNAVIDLGQEVYRIAGQYVGDFLGYLVGGAGGPLQGNVRFLLDQQANQLLAYAAENPLDKRTFDIPRTDQNPNARNQLIGNINVYGGPGSDPRDLTRQMMFQVNSAQYAGALAQ